MRARIDECRRIRRLTPTVAGTIGAFAGTLISAEPPHTPVSRVTGSLIGRAAPVPVGSPPRRRAAPCVPAGAAPRPGWDRS